MYDISSNLPRYLIKITKIVNKIQNKVYYLGRYVCTYTK